MKHTRREDFARFFCHVIEADPALYRGILCYLATLAAIVVIRLAVDSTGAWLMGMVKPSRAPLPHPSMVTGEEQHDEEEQEEAAGMHKEIALLAFLVGLELVQDVLRKHMFVLLNKFVRDPFHIAGVRYALTAIHNSSPHWISGMNPSMLRKHVEEGLGAYRAVLARMSYIAPVALVAITSLTSLGLWFSPKYTLIIVLGWSAFYYTYGARITTEIREGDREVQTNRNKFSHMLELEYGRMAQVATRGEAEFRGFAQRLSAYESFFPLASAPFRWRSTRLQSTQVLLLHSLAAVVLVLFVQERFQYGSRAERLGQFVYLYNLLQRCLQSMQTLLEHKHYFMNEATPHVNLERLLEERIPASPATPQHVREQAVALLRGRFEITIHRATIRAHFGAGHDFQLLVERPIAASAGDVVFIVGPNGAGKSTFLKVLAGELQSHGGASGGYGVKMSASLRGCVGHEDQDGPAEGEFKEEEARMEFDFANCADVDSAKGTAPASHTAGLDVFKCLRDSGVVAELPQGELRDIRRTRMGDVFWRMNGLMADPVAEDFELPVEAAVQARLTQLVVDCLRAVGLEQRLRTEKLAAASESALMQLMITDMSGGELQRLRLAAFFYMEIVRWQVHDGQLPSELLDGLQREPARVMILDEPDRSLDTAGANSTIANLLSLLGPRQSSVVLIVVLHSEIQPEIWSAAVRGSSSRLITLAVARDAEQAGISTVQLKSVREAN